MNLKRTNIIYFVLSMILLVAIAEDEKYNSQYDNIDADAILGNVKLRTQYVNCYLGFEKCLTADAKFIKEKFPEALQTNCRKCTDKQKIFFEQVTLWFGVNEPETLKKIITHSIVLLQNESKTK